MSYAKEWSDKQKAVVAILPKISSTLSIVGSSYIIYHNLNSSARRHDRLKSTRNLLLVSLSFSDIIGSIGYFASTWSIPADDTQSLVVFNMGNEVTCQTQGVFLQFGLMSGALYNSCLSVYYLLSVRYSVSNEKMKKTFLPLFHFISITHPLITSIISLRRNYFHPTPSSCWISNFPRDCVGDECVFGNSLRIQMYFAWIPICLCLFIITASMTLLYKSIKRQEESMDSYIQRWSIRMPDKKTQSYKVYIQALKYIGAFSVVWLPVIFQSVIARLYVDSPTAMFCSGVIMIGVCPLQGFFNALIYKNYNPVGSFVRSIRGVTKSIFSPEELQKAAQETETRHSEKLET